MLARAGWSTSPHFDLSHMANSDLESCNEFFPSSFSRALPQRLSLRSRPLLSAERATACGARVVAAAAIPFLLMSRAMGQ